jgi:Tol biopolymer transport system component
MRILPSAARSLSPLAALVALALTLGLSAPADAAAARNGSIAFQGPDRPELGIGNQLWLVGSGGKRARGITETLYGAATPAWSPDGRKLAYEDLLGRVVIASSGVLQRRTLAEGDLVPAVDGHRYDAWGGPSWAPDGRRLVVHHSGGLGAQEVPGLYVVGEDGERRMLTSDASDRSPAWSPDGGRIAFTRCSSGPDGCAIWIVDAGGGAPARITPTGVNSHSADWSPDGTRIAYEVGTPRGTGQGIHTVRPDGSDRRRIYPSGYTPAYSPDGRQIVFSKRDGLYVIRADGGGERRVFAGPNADPDWQPGA